MTVFIKKYFFLVAAALVLITGIYFVVRRATPHETYVDRIQKGLQAEVQQTRQSMEQLLNLVPVASNKPFAELLEEHAYPYFLYKDSTLLMWSDYRFALNFKNLEVLPSDMQVMSIQQGKFLLLVSQKEAGGSQYRLVSLIRLFSLVKHEDIKLSLGYNSRIFPAAPETLSLTPVGQAEAIKNTQGETLFYVVPPHDTLSSSHTVPLVAQILISLALLLAGIQLILLIRRPENRHRYGFVLLCLYAYLIVLRGLMVCFSIPYAFGSASIFNRQLYSISWMAPSLGDLLLNYVCFVILLVYVNSIYYRTSSYRQLLRSDEAFQSLVSCLMLLVSNMMFYFCYQELSDVYKKAYFTLDITRSISFSPEKITGLLLFICLSAGYFLSTHLIMSIFLRLNPRYGKGLGVLLVSTLLTALAAWGLHIAFEWIFLVHIAYLLLLYLTRLPRTFYNFRYPTTVYYLAGALACALVMTYIIVTQERKKDVQAKEKFARQVMSNSDLFAEFLLKENSEHIARDTVIQQLLAENTPLASEIIQQRIKTSFLDYYLGQYDVEILSFERNGASLNNGTTIQAYDSLRNLYGRPEFTTSTHSALFHVNAPEEGVARQYLSFIPILIHTDTVGYVALNLQMRHPTAPLRNSEFVLDEKLAFMPGAMDYSHATFENGKQITSFGAYNYERKLPLTVLQDSALYSHGLDLFGFRHVGVRIDATRQVVVSSPSWGWKGILANYSFLYLVLVIVVSLAIIGHALQYRVSSSRLTYSTKIQVMLNAAFILPLLIVLFCILKIIENHYQQNQREAQLENSRNISLNVVGYMNDYEHGKMSRGYLEQQIQKIALDADLDINLYDTTGRLFFSSKPLIYETGLLSTLINPVAQKQIVEQKEQQTLLQESLGNKTYNTTYVGLRTYDHQLLGVLSVPFFDARPSLDRQVIDIVASVLIVFTAMLLIFLLISYVAANLLIDPLRVLTRKISTTTLEQPNEPLVWQSNDEIGTLIKKYNQMLVNLETTKQAISTNEKQSAWRDMARQVAHEIKNPLTPIKLTLQQLQRTIRRDDPQALEKVGRAMESVIEQIDNIGYIAQSFSDIARMPPPKTEFFEITTLATQAFDNYLMAQSENEKAVYFKEIQPGPYYVNGDRQQIANSLVNLLRNARQSVPEGRSAEVYLRLYTHNENIQVEIRDNGSGIPKSIRNRVFLPNFSTREGGTGLNLAIAKRIIEYAGGSIWFETEEGVGTTFFFSIPIAKT